MHVFQLHGKQQGEGRFQRDCPSGLSSKLQHKVCACCLLISKSKQLRLYTLELIGTSGYYISRESEDHKCLKKSFPLSPQLVHQLHSQKVLQSADSSVCVVNGNCHQARFSRCPPGP